MAKINARGAHEVARWITTRTIDIDGYGIEVQDLWVLCSDGRLLVRLYRYNGSVESGTFNLRGKVGNHKGAEAIAWVSRYLAKRYQVERVSR